VVLRRDPNAPIEIENQDWFHPCGVPRFDGIYNAANPGLRNRGHALEVLAEIDRRIGWERNITPDNRELAHDMIAHISEWPAGNSCPGCGMGWGFVCVFAGINAVVEKGWEAGAACLIVGVLLTFLGICYYCKKMKGDKIIRQREQEALGRAESPSLRV
jgi:hypothetical protein